MKIDGVYTSEKDSWKELSSRYYGSNAVIRLDEGFIDFSRSSYKRITDSLLDVSYGTYLAVQHECLRNEPALARLYFSDQIQGVILHGVPGRQNQEGFYLHQVLLYKVTGKDQIHLGGVFDRIQIMDQDRAIYRRCGHKNYLCAVGFICRYMKRNRSGHWVMHYGVLSDEKCVHVSRIDQILPCEEREYIGEVICRICPLARKCGNSSKDECLADDVWYRQIFMKFLRLYLLEQEVDHGTV